MNELLERLIIVAEAYKAASNGSGLPVDEEWASAVIDLAREAVKS